MSIPEEKMLNYEDAAVPVVITAPDGMTATGWMSVRSRTIWRDSDEHHARWSDCTHLPCSGYGNEPCPDQARIRRYDMCCSACIGRRHAYKWQQALPRAVDWDRSTPLTTWESDHYMWDMDDVYSYLDSRFADDPEISLSDIRLELCQSNPGSDFSLCDHLEGDLHDDFDWPPGAKEVEQTVNDWIKANGPYSWTGSGTPINPESLRFLIDHWDNPDQTGRI